MRSYMSSCGADGVLGRNRDTGGAVEGTGLPLVELWETPKDEDGCVAKFLVAEEPSLAFD